MKYMKGSVLLALLLLLGFGGVAEAQECIVKAGSGNARAEGTTEMAGTITLRCRGSRAGEGLGFGNTAPTKLEIAVTLNTDVTNDRDSSDMIMNKANANADGSGTTVGHSEGMVVLTARVLDDGQDATGDDLDANFSGGAVSDDLQTVTWKVMDVDDPADGITDEVELFQLTPLGVGDTEAAANRGFELMIMGLRVDASGVGDGGEVTATVSVNGSAVGSPVKVAGVTTGLAPVVNAAKGRECDDADSIMARVTIREGNKNSFNQMDSFLLTFRNIPEGVTVMVPETVDLETDQPGTNIDEMDGSFIVNLVEGRAGDGVGKPEGGMAPVELSATGTGEVRYTVGMSTRAATQDDVDAAAAETPSRTIALGSDIHEPTVGTSFSGQEWAHVPVYFSWDGGAVTMNADAMVYVSFYPTGGSMIPRFVGDGEADGLLTVEDCITMLTFPFVSSASGYDTGIVVSNTADASGSCTATYSGSDDVMSSPVVEGNAHWIFLVSSHMQDYTGRLEVECDFGGIDGYAQINDHMGNANGYLPRM